MRGRVIGDSTISYFRPIFMDPNFRVVLIICVWRPQHSAIIDASQISVRFHIMFLRFRSAGYPKATGVEYRSQISQFLTPCEI